MHSEDLLLLILIVLPLGFARLFWSFAQHIRHKPPARWPQLLLGNALVLFFLLSMLLLAGELFFRFIYDTTDSLGYTKVAQAWIDRHWHHNVFGVRDDVEYEWRGNLTRRRVTFVGDSFTAGYGIKDVENRFVNRVRKAHPEWEVHMIASPGLDTGDELKMIGQALGRGYQLDEVVLVYCLNDIADIVPEWLEAKDRFPAEAKKGGFFVRNSYFLNLLYHRAQISKNPYMKDYYGFVREAYRGPLWEQQKQRLKEFRDLVESHGGKLCVVTFPFFHVLGPDYPYQFVHEELGQWWHELGVPHLDLLNTYRNVPRKQLIVNRFDVHPNEHANALATEAIEPFLKQHMAIDKPTLKPELSHSDKDQ